MLKKIATLLILCVSFSGLTQEYFDMTKDNKPLPFKDAFNIEFSQQDNKAYVYLSAVEGYYLYKDRINLTTSAKTKNLLWEGIEYKEDPHFGNTPTIQHYGVLSFDIESKDTVPITISAQGCSNKGFCYMPTSFTFTVEKIIQEETNPHKGKALWFFVLLIISCLMLVNMILKKKTN